MNLKPRAPHWNYRLHSAGSLARSFWAEKIQWVEIVSASAASYLNRRYKTRLTAICGNGRWLLPLKPAHELHFGKYVPSHGVIQTGPFLTFLQS